MCLECGARWGTAGHDEGQTFLHAKQRVGTTETTKIAEKSTFHTLYPTLTKPKIVRYSYIKFPLIPSFALLFR